MPLKLCLVRVYIPCISKCSQLDSYEIACLRPLLIVLPNENKALYTPREAPPSTKLALDSIKSLVFVNALCTLLVINPNYYWVIQENHVIRK